MRLPRVPAELAAQLQMPWRTVRLRLTLLYGGLFLVSSAGLLAITYLLVRTSAFVSGKSGGVVIGTGGPAGLPGPQQVQGLMQNQVTAVHSADLSKLLLESGIALGMMTVIAAGLGWLTAGRVLRPLRTITTAARNISASNLHQRLALDGPDDELKELGDTFDGLLGRLERSFDAQRQFAANASHELRTPLARQRTLVEVALADPAPTISSLQAACERVLVAEQQQERLIEALLTLARSQRGLDRREPLDLSQAASEVLQARDTEADRRRLRIDAALSPAPALGDPGLTERLAANLVDNALRHNVPGGWIKVLTGVSDGRAMLSVANSGPDVPRAEIHRLFGPFQRLAAERTRTQDSVGLGLSIVLAIAAAHDAELRARPLPAGGLEVEVRFPPAESTHNTPRATTPTT